VQPPCVTAFRCPDCGSPLAFDPSGASGDGTLRCAHGHQFPYVGGIARFRSDSGYAASFGEQWNRFRRTQLDKFNGTTLSRDRFFTGTGWSPDDLRGASVLEVGCGAGRFTQVMLDAGAAVFAVDYSNAVDACVANNGPSNRLCAAQADIYRLPFARGSFDFVFCYGVLQHTPDPHRAFLSLVPFLKPGGRLAVDVYRRAWELQPYKSKYLWRPITTKMSTERLFRLLEWFIPRWLPVDTAIKRIPFLGRVLGMIVPCWNYAFLPLTREQRVEWAILDTFDALAPVYDLPQSESTLRRWFEEARLLSIDVRVGGNGVLGNARGPAAAQSAPC